MMHLSRWRRVESIGVSALKVGLRRDDLFTSTGVAAGRAARLVAPVAAVTGRGVALGNEEVDEVRSQ